MASESAPVKLMVRCTNVRFMRLFSIKVSGRGLPPSGDRCAMDFIPNRRDKEAKLADPPVLGPTKAELPDHDHRTGRLRRRWTVTKSYGFDPTEALQWPEENLAEGNGHLEIQRQG
jgi:hypothetical protein